MSEDVRSSKVDSFKGKNRGDTVSCSPGDTNPSDATAVLVYEKRNT